MDALRSIDDTAKTLGISPYTVRAWIRRGLLASVKLGARRLVAESEIQRVIENGIDTLSKSNVTTNA
jgi:excisionase family DNA binding protein